MGSKYIIVTIAAVMCLLPSCKMRPRDVERLTAEADAGNRKSMETLMCHADTLVSKDLLLHYMDILAEEGNYKALTYKYMQENGGAANWSVMRDKNDVARYMRWMKKGAEKGNPDCMYELAVQYDLKKVASGTNFTDNPYYDFDKAVQWSRQAADSCHAYARTNIRHWSGKETVLDRPRFTARQIWKYNARGQNVFNKASNAAFHYMADCVNNTFNLLFSKLWWQALLMAVVILVVIVGVIFYGFKFEGKSAVSIGASSIYGWLNGFTLFFIADGQWQNASGIFGSFDGMCHFTHQPGTYSLMSDICVWATWIWVILFVVMFVDGIITLHKQGSLTIFSLLKYIIATVLINVLFYLLGGALSIFSEVIAIIAGIVLFGALFRHFAPKEGDIIIYGAGPLGSNISASPAPGRPGVYQTSDGRYFRKDPGSGELKEI